MRGSPAGAAAIDGVAGQGKTARRNGETAKQRGDVHLRCRVTEASLGRVLRIRSSSAKSVSAQRRRANPQPYLRARPAGCSQRLTPGPPPHAKQRFLAVWSSSATLKSSAHCPLAAMSAAECSFTGNSDLFGLGVRIGLYGQWIATLLITVFDAANESPFRLLNLIVQTSIFLGLCTESGERHNAVASVITQLLLCGSLSSVTGDGIVHFGRTSGVLRLFFYLALSAYGVWFWFNGIDEMESECQGRDIAFFGPSTINGWFRSLGKAASVAGLVACVALLGFCAFQMIRRFKGGLKQGFTRPSGRRPQVEISLMLASMGLIGLSIATVEYLIRENDIKGVGAQDIGTVAQLIPLLAGALACFLALWKVVTHRLFLRKRCWLLFGWHL